MLKTNDLGCFLKSPMQDQLKVIRQSLEDLKMNACLESVTYFMIKDNIEKLQAYHTLRNFRIRQTNPKPLTSTLSTAGEDDISRIAETVPKNFLEQE